MAFCKLCDIVCSVSAEAAISSIDASTSSDDAATSSVERAFSCAFTVSCSADAVTCCTRAAMSCVVEDTLAIVGAICCILDKICSKRAALGRIKAKVFVMPIDEDMFFPVRDCEAEQKLIPNSELKVIHSVCGHFGLFGADGADYFRQVDGYLNELLATKI